MSLSAPRLSARWLLACAGAVLACRPRTAAVPSSPISNEPVVAEAVFSYLAAEFRKPRKSALGDRRLELDTRRLQWIDGQLGLLSELIRFDGQHSEATIARVLQYGGVEGRCHSRTTDRVCESEANAAVVIAMSSPRFVRPDSATVRVVMFSELRDAVGELSWIGAYLLTLQRSPEGWAVISEQMLFET